MNEHDSVNHPTHYTSHPSGIECIQITRHHNFDIGNAIKYLWRAGIKDKKTNIEDLKKAIWYINDEIATLQKQEPNNLRQTPHSFKANTVSGMCEFCQLSMNNPIHHNATQRA